MSTFITIGFAVFGVVLVFAGVLSIVFRKRLGVNIAMSGALPALSASPSLAGWVMGLLQLVLAAGAFVLSVSLPRKMSAGELDAIVAHAVSSLGDWAIPIAAGMAVVGVLQCGAAIAVLNTSWVRRETWNVDDGPLEVPRRDRRLIYGGVLLLVCGAMFLGCGLMLITASLA